MTVRELIALLEETGCLDADVCVDNIPVVCVEKQPAYYDGRLEVLHGKWYRPDRAEFRGSGFKVRLKTYGIEEALFMNPEMPVDGCENGYGVEEWRQQGRDFEARKKPEEAT